MTATQEHVLEESVYARVNRCESHPGSLRDVDVRKPEDEICIHRNWHEVKGKLRQRYPTLTEADVQYEPGRKPDMLRAIETKLGLTPAQLQRKLAYL